MRTQTLMSNSAALPDAQPIFILREKHVKCIVGTEKEGRTWVKQHTPGPSKGY